ncbi:CHAT domain-containing protein [Leptolyngbya sp. PCC 6406]|uniref:CHAT domain-containing protein n=1 Tax=Leptolyngbya sp. PCC 6406 TaxID=1173264 RepID=UPI0002AB9AD5|nr:CHAT domain-containing protein [Leptolyngbya sp. PCC 6406]
MVSVSLRSWTTLLPMLSLSLATPIALLLPAPAQAEEIATDTEAATNRLAEGDRLLELGTQYYQDNQFSEALQTWQQALDAYQNSEIQAYFPRSSQIGQAVAKVGIGLVHRNEGQYSTSISYYTSALEIFQDFVIPSVRSGIAVVRVRSSCNASVAVETSFHEQDLIRYIKILTELFQANESYVHRNGDIEFYEDLSALEADIFIWIGTRLYNQYDCQGAFDFYVHALKRVFNQRRYEEISSLLRLTLRASSTSENYDLLLEMSQEIFQISKNQNDDNLKKTLFDFLESILANHSLYQQAVGTNTLESWNKAVAILRIFYFAESNINGTPKLFTIERLGVSSYYLGRYDAALDFYREALDLASTREVSDRLDLVRHDDIDQFRAMQFNHMALVYRALGDHSTAQALIDQALLIFEGTCPGNDCPTEIRSIAYSLGYQGLILLDLNQCSQALEILETANTLRGGFVQDSWWEPAHEIMVGTVQTHACLENYQDAIESLEDLITSLREAPHTLEDQIAFMYNDLASFKLELMDFEESIRLNQEALLIHRSYLSKEGEAASLAGIADALRRQLDHKLAIVFYKNAINIWEEIRAANRPLTPGLQQAYVSTIANNYRALADLLLQQNRVLEAQRVLDLLRVQELDDYLGGVRSNAQTQSGVDLRGAETEISNRTVAIGYQLAQLRAIPFGQLSEAQRQQLAALDTQQQQQIQDFRGFITSPEIQSLVAQLAPGNQSQDLLAELESFVNLQQSLAALDQNAVMIYPVILPDRLELVLLTPFSEPARYPVAVSQGELNEAILAFRQALDDPFSDPRPIAQQLYQWLIAPMADDLAAIGAETLLYAPDGALRYIPLAALHDGEQWLVEQYRINHITAASLQNLGLLPNSQPQILAAAFSQGFFEFQVGQRSFSFGGLPFAGVEVENLAAAFPGTTTFNNDEFSRSVVELAMDSHTIVHLATHAAFVPGAPWDSFILFGNGDRLSLQEIRDTWQGRFNRVELVVLSACETGLGGDALGSGEEILGFGYLMQAAGARAAIASLWQVNDGGTQVLMNAFYGYLDQGMSKAEALRQAQVALISGDFTATSGLDPRGSIEVVSSRHQGLPATVINNLTHPYYWAPFILIGNGL